MLIYIQSVWPGKFTWKDKHAQLIATTEGIEFKPEEVNLGPAATKQYIISLNLTEWGMLLSPSMFRIVHAHLVAIAGWAIN